MTYYYSDSTVTLYCGTFEDNPQWLEASLELGVAA